MRNTDSIFKKNSPVITVPPVDRSLYLYNVSDQNHNISTTPNQVMLDSIMRKLESMDRELKAIPALINKVTIIQSIIEAEFHIKFNDYS